MGKLLTRQSDNHFTMNLTLDKIGRRMDQEDAEMLERSKRHEVQQSNIVYALDDLLEKSEALNLHCSTSLSDLTRQLERQLEASYKTQSIVQGMEETLIRLSEETQMRRSQLRLLESLTDPVMKMRESSICRSHAKTYEWMLTPSAWNQYPDVQFLEWLAHETGVFWIAGKPGCGKSTLMRFVYSEERTRFALEEWAGDKRLIVGGHFFWIAGYDLQRSQDGLLRSLLYTILAEYPLLMPTVIPERWGGGPPKQGHPWTRSELLDSLQRFCRLSIPDAKFCFFIDALDEYSDSQDELADIIAMLCGKQNVKICLSSREWPIFDIYFGEDRELASLPVRQIHLQMFTRDDIGRYTKDRLEQSPRYQRLRALQPGQLIPKQKEALVEEIIDRAEGVFLWVSLVCDELLRGFTNLDSIDTLQLRLRGLPTDLEQFFLRMIERVEPVYHAQCAQILQLLFAARRPIPTRLLDFIDDEPLFGTRDEPTLLPCNNETRIVQLKARCADLVEFVDRQEQTWKFGPDVTFMHRTVRDFLITPPIQSFLIAKLPTGFRVDWYMFQVLATQLRLAWRMGVRFERDEVRVITEDIVHHIRRLELQSEDVSETIDNLLQLIPFFYFTWVTDTIPNVLGLSAEQRDQFIVLIFAMNNNLHACAARLLDANPSLLSLAPDQDCLLYYALRGILAPKLPNGVNSDGILKTIRVILSRGASPNQVLVDGGTPWTHLVAAANNDQGGGNDRRAGIVVAMIEAGACEHAFDRRTILNTRLFSIPHQKKIAWARRQARLRGFASWHFPCYWAYATTPLRVPIVAFIDWARVVDKKVMLKLFMIIGIPASLFGALVFGADSIRKEKAAVEGKQVTMSDLQVLWFVVSPIPLVAALVFFAMKVRDRV